MVPKKSEDGQNHRTVERRCIVCDRGHMCFDIEAGPKSMSGPPTVGASFKVPRDVIGAWHGEHETIPSGTTVKVKKHMMDNSGDWRAMVELPNGKALWMAASLLN